ncbi:MAG: hypothetical protein QOJ06_181 [Pseudonocardiales bacterium]|nr:hypothetical protein [Pseudonocardiales bacterium]
MIVATWSGDTEQPFASERPSQVRFHINPPD